MKLHKYEWQRLMVTMYFTSSSRNSKYSLWISRRRWSTTISVTAPITEIIIQPNSEQLRNGELGTCVPAAFVRFSINRRETITLCPIVYIRLLRQVTVCVCVCVCSSSNHLTISRFKSILGDLTDKKFLFNLFFFLLNRKFVMENIDSPRRLSRTRPDEKA